MDKLLDKIQNKSARVLVVGAGYVGLPLAMRCAQEGFKTFVYDIDKTKINHIDNGRSYIGDVSSEELYPLVLSGELRGIWHLDQLTPPNKLDPEKPDIILICVPTPLNKRRDPDVSYIVGAAENLVEEGILDDEQLVILESTVYPGFTREVLLPVLSEHGINEPYVAFSPERVDPGNEKFGIKNTPKVVGGMGEKATELATKFYEQIIDTVVSVSSADAAEMTKIYENTFRMINIGLANETALACRKLKINVWEVIEAAATKPFGFMPFRPGPGVGGHCIAIDPHYLSWKLKSLKYNSKFIELAEEINSSMPGEVVRLVDDALNHVKKPINGSRVLIVGVAYKLDIDDVRESPALDVIEILNKKGADISYYDPFVPEIKIGDGIMKSIGKFNTRSFYDYDCFIIITNHSDIDYKSLLFKAESHNIVVVDSRNATKGIEYKNLYKIML